MAAYPEPRTREGRQRNPQAYVNMAGGAVSAALIIGVCVWGYQLVMRDANGIPVVRAMEGPMRVAPSEPGGIISDHSGLAVNAVAALGGAAAPEDSEVLLLAPTDVGLTTEDISVQPTAEAGEVMPQGVDTAAAEETVPTAAPVIAPIDPTVAAAAVAAPEVPATAPAAPAAPMTADDIIAMADQLAAGQEPLTGEAPASAPVATAINGVSSDFIADIIPSDVPGVAKSPRPPARPATIVASAQVTEASPAAVEAALAAAAMTGTAAGAPATVTQADAIPVGTNLAQLGAYDSPEIAAKEWDRFVGRFGEYMVGKERIIQQAERGGRTFYRLRVKNFEDLSDARRFCAALSAENTDCVPVVVR